MICLLRLYMQAPPVGVMLVKQHGLCSLMPATVLEESCPGEGLHKGLPTNSRELKTLGLQQAWAAILRYRLVAEWPCLRQALLGKVISQRIRLLSIRDEGTSQKAALNKEVN